MSLLENSRRLLARQAEAHPAVLVAYSGGKDSLVVLDLCLRAFKAVVCFHMYFVPGLRVIEGRIEYARKRWGVSVLQYPNWGLLTDLRNAVYCDLHEEFRGAPPTKAADVYALVRHETGVPLLATGDKKMDFVARRAAIRSNRDPNLIFPVADWHNRDVLAYLRTHDIDAPDSAGDATGVDLTTDSLLWLHDKHPEDFRELCREFPYAGACVARREFYGVK